MIKSEPRRHRDTEKTAADGTRNTVVWLQEATVPFHLVFVGLLGALCVSVVIPPHAAKRYFDPFT